MCETMVTWLFRPLNLYDGVIALTSYALTALPPDVHRLLVGFDADNAAHRKVRQRVDRTHRVTLLPLRAPPMHHGVRPPRGGMAAVSVAMRQVTSAYCPDVAHRAADLARGMQLAARHVFPGAYRAFDDLRCPQPQNDLEVEQPT